MTSRLVLVDTQIWLFSGVEPAEEEFREIHRAAKGFLESLLEDGSVRIGMSAYQEAEVLEVLRRSGVPEDHREALLEDMESPKFLVVDLTAETVRRASLDSSESGIHVYDYLVTYPLRGLVDRIYSADRHFLHRHFTSVAPVENPLSPWSMVEGQRPSTA